MSADPIIDDVFTRYERLQTQDVATITEANIGRLAQLLKWTVDYSGEEPVLVKPDNGRGYGGRRFELGEHVDSRGAASSVLGWRPAGTWQEVGP